MVQDRREFLKGTAWMGAAAVAAGCMSDKLRLTGGGSMSGFRVAPMKEIRVGVSVAAVLCLINCVRMMLLVKGITPTITIVVNITLFITITFAKIIGCLLPMLAKRLKLDPALMASPMITTIVDAFTLVTYFLVAQNLLHIAA